MEGHGDRDVKSRSVLFRIWDPRLTYCVVIFVLAFTQFVFSGEVRANSAPTFSSSDTASVAENTTSVLTVVATDADAEDSVTGYTKSGGADASKFSLTSAGVLSFSSAPDFENPTDTGDTAGDNTYVVEVTATSGTGDRVMTATQIITVTVTDVNEAPSFSASAQTLSVAENTATATDIGAELPTATDPDDGDSLSYSLEGTDADSFTLSGRQLKTKAALNYEDKTSYSVTLRASDGAFSADLAVTINVTDLNDVAPMFADSTVTREVAENTATGQNIGAALPAATDPDTVGSLTYTLEGTDASSFNLDASTRRLKTKAPLNFEGKTQYSVTVRVSDGVNADTVAVTINVTDVNEPPAAPAAPTVTSISATELTVTWTAPANAGKPDITNYDLQYGVRNGSTTTKSDVGTDLTESLTTLTAGSLYNVQVKAKNDEGASGWSSVGSGWTAPPKVTGVNVTAAVDALQVSWTAAKGATGYKVQWKSGSETFGSSRQNTATETSNTISNLTAGVTYTVRVIGTHANTPDGAPSDDATGVPLAGVSIDAVSSPVTEGTDVEFTLTRSSGTAALPVTVSVTRTASFLESHTATNPSTETVTFSANASTATLTLATHADTWEEDDGTFQATVTAGSGYRPVTSKSASVTVQDNDPTPVLSLAAQTVNEGDGTVQVCVSMTPPSHKPVQVPLSTSDGTAVSAGDKDYTAVDATLTIAPGSAADAPNTQACADLTVTDDPLLEDSETLTATLGSPLNAAVSTTNGTATVTIADNETAAAVDLNDATLSVAEDTDSALEVCATLTPLAGKPIEVALSTGDGSAKAGRDYTGLTNAVLAFPVETANACLEVTIIDNTDDDGDRDFTASLSAPSGLDSRVTVGGTTGTATVTIQDEDVVPGAPQNVNADPWSSEVLLTWEAGNAGSDPITGYEYRYKGSGDYGGWTSAGLVTGKMVSGLTNGQVYTFQVRAVNEVGAGAESSGENATPQFSLTRVTVDAQDTSITPGTELGTGAIFRVHRTGATSRPLNVGLYVEKIGPSTSANNEDVTFPRGVGTVQHEINSRLTDTLTRATVNDSSGYVVGTPSVAEVTIVANADNLPGAPGSLQATRGGGQVALSWTAGTPGASAITKHRYRQRTGAAFGLWQDIPTSAPNQANATSYTVSGLTNGTEYTFQVQAVNDEGGGPASNEASATPTGADITVPVLSSAAVNLETVTLTYNEPLDGDSTPPASAFTVTAPGSPRTVSAVSVAGPTVTFAIDPPVAAGDTATLTYTIPTGTNATPIRDVAGNDAEAVSGRTLTNDSPTTPDAPTALMAERGNAQVTLSWTPSASDGGSPVTMHQYRQRQATPDTYGGWMDIPDSAPGGANAQSFTVVTGLTNETQYFFQVQAVNRVGGSGESNEADATPTAADITPPELVSAQVDGDALTLTYNEPLNATPPAASLFTVAAGSTTSVVSRVAVDGATITLTLTPAVPPGETVRLTYEPVLGGPQLIQDQANNNAGSFSARPVPNLPGAPENRAPAQGNGRVTLNWSPGSDGGSPVTGYEYRQRGGTQETYGEVWTPVPNSAPGGSNDDRYVVGNLTNGVPYFFQVRAVNAVGESPASNEVNATPQARDATPPEFLSAAVDGTTLTLDYNEALDETSTPPANAFTVTGDQTPHIVDAVAVSGATVTLTLSEPVVEGVTVTLTYTVPTGTDATPIRDVAGNAASALSGQSVENDTTALSITDESALESAGSMTFTVSLSAERDSPMSVTYATSNGTATAGEDYTAASGTLTFSVGEIEQTIEVALIDDAVEEEDETFTVTLTGPEGATLGVATGTITDDDATTRPPMVETGTTRTVLQGAQVTLDGTGRSDLDEEGLTYRWTYTGHRDDVVLRGADTAVAMFTAPVGLREDLELTFRLEVTDPHGASWHGTESIIVSSLAAVKGDGQLRLVPGRGGEIAVDGHTLTLEVVTRGNPVPEGLALTLPPGLGNTGITTIRFDLAPENVPGAPAGYRVGGLVVDITLDGNLGAGEKVTVCLPADQADMKLYRYDEGSGVWIDLMGRVETQGGVVSVCAETENFSLFGMFSPEEVRASDEVGGTKAWLARLGRTAAGHVVDAVGERLRGAPGQASHVTVGGYQLPLGKKAVAGETEPGSALLEGLAGLLGLGPAQSAGAGSDGGLGTSPGFGGAWPAAGAGPDPRLGQSQPLDVDLRRILLGSSFRLTLGADDDDGASASRLTAWGRVAGTQFDGRDGALALDGDVLTGTLGVDAAWERWLAGLAVSHSRSEGAFSAVAGGQGDLDTTLTSVHPYLRYRVNERVDLWGVLGYGWGELTLNQAQAAPLKTDTALLMGAFGGRGILLPAEKTGGFQLATRTDAMLTRMTSEDVTGIESAKADAHRLRLILEGSRGVTWDEGQSLTPTVELGVRHDWGDAETGFGLEVGGRVQYADPGRGLLVEGAGRVLLAHEDEAYEEWGASGTVRLAPGPAGQGLALTISPTWGAAASGVEGLWSRQTAAGLAGGQNQGASGGRLAVEVGYGHWAPSLGGMVTPFTGLNFTDEGRSQSRVGLVFDRPGTSVGNLRMELAGERIEAPLGEPEHRVGLHFQLRFDRNGGATNSRAAPVSRSTIGKVAAVSPGMLPETRRQENQPGSSTPPASQDRAAATPPASLPNTSQERAGGRRYFVQVGVFSRHANAVKARTELAVGLSGLFRHNTPKFAIAASKRDGLSRIVFAHAFTTRKAAAALCAAIKARGTDCFVKRAWYVSGKKSRRMRVETSPKGLDPKNSRIVVSSHIRSLTR